MNPYEELAGYRFGSGRDYDKRSVETFRARVLNLVDDLLNQVTQLQDEVADLRDRCRTAAADPAGALAVAPAVPTSWLDALAGAAGPDAPGGTDAEAGPLVSASLSPAAFPAPALGNWLADLERPDADDDDDGSDEGAASTAELLLAAAGNAVAFQAAALAGLHPEPLQAAPPDAGVDGITAPTGPVVSPAPPPTGLVTAVSSFESVPPTPPAPEAPIQLHPVDAGAAPAPSRSMTVTPGARVIVEPAPITELSRLPIVLDDGLPPDEPLPTPVRHWGGWMRDNAPLDPG